jgi:hypothetical protein
MSDPNKSNAYYICEAIILVTLILALVQCSGHGF